MIVVGKNNLGSETKEDHFSFGVKYQLHSVGGEEVWVHRAKFGCTKGRLHRDSYINFKKIKIKTTPPPAPRYHCYGNPEYWVFC